MRSKENKSWLILYHNRYQSDISDRGPQGVIQNCISNCGIRLRAAECDTELYIYLRHPTDSRKVYYRIVYQSEISDWEPQAVIQNCISIRDIETKTAGCDTELYINLRHQDWEPQGVIQNCISILDIRLRAAGCDTELYINLRHWD